MNLGDVLIPLVTLTVLQANAVGPAASAQYGQALLGFLSWLRSRGVWRVQTMAGVDLCLARFFDELDEYGPVCCWREDDGSMRAPHALYPWAVAHQVSEC